MNFVKEKKLAIITEFSILEQILETVTELGADGYSISNISGKGKRKGIRDGGSIGGTFKNVRIDIIVHEDIAIKISHEVVNKYFKNYAGFIYMVDADILYFSEE